MQTPIYKVEQRPYTYSIPGTSVLVEWNGLFLQFLTEDPPK